MESAGGGVFGCSGGSVGVARESGGELVFGAFFGLRVGLLVFGRGGTPKSAKSTTGNSAEPLTASSITISDQLPEGAKKGDVSLFQQSLGSCCFLEWANGHDHVGWHPLRLVQSLNRLWQSPKNRSHRPQNRIRL
jgi:hypothetical protein